TRSSSRWRRRTASCRRRRRTARTSEGAMRIRLRGRWAWALIAVVVAVAVGVTGWLTTREEPPVPEIPRVPASAFTDREVKMDVAGAARHVEDEPRSAAVWGQYGIVLRA